MKKKILQLVFNGFTSDSRVLRHSLSAIRAGYEVEVLALHEDGLPEKEVVSGIPVTRIHLQSRDLPKKIPFQVLKYFELATQTVLKRKHFDIIHCNDLEPLPLAVALKKMSRRPVSILYDAHEFQTERSATQRKWLKKAKAKTEQNLIRFVDDFVTVSPLIAKEYSCRYKIQAPEVIVNCPMPFDGSIDGPKTDYFREAFAISPQKKIFIYQGLINKIRGVDKLIDAFSGTDLAQNAALVLLGHGDMAPQTEKTQINENIFFHPAVPYDKLLSLTKSADFGLVTLEKNCLNHDLAMPNKLFEYASVGLPVLSVRLKQISEVFDEYQMGVLIDNLSTANLTEGVKEALGADYAEMSQASAHFSQRYNWYGQEKTLLKIYSRLTHNH